MGKWSSNGLIKYLLLIILVFDLSYSFWQHYNMPMDGDLAPIVVPSEEYKPILTDPLGLGVLLKGESYANPNRYFAHWTLVNYFKTVPNLLQQFTSPISSVYLACALAKALIQLILIILLAYYTSNFKRVWSLKFLVPAFLIFSLFQTVGYNRYMGIVDPSIVYTFAYAWPIALMLLFYLPVYKILTGGKLLKMRILQLILFTLLAIIITLNGALVPALMIIINGLIILRWVLFEKHQSRSENLVLSSLKSLGKMPKSLLYLLLVSSALSIYSLAIGMFNSQNDMSQITFLEYYARLPVGLFTLITTKLGWPLLIIFIIINIFLIKRGAQNKEKKQILVLFSWILVFACIYILFLPLGGYRWYRPNAIRYDTFIPVTLACIFIFARSSFYLLNTFKSRNKLIYATFILGFVVFFTVNDDPNTDANACERNQFRLLSESKTNPVELPGTCTLMSWEKITDPKDSDLQAELIYFWGITDEKKLYYQK